MGILNNWDKIEEEFDLWDKTIDRSRNIGFGAMIVGVAIGLTVGSFTGQYMWGSLLFIGFSVGGLIYSIVIGERQIQAHKDRIAELKK